MSDTPESGRTASEGAPDEPQSDSVYDFLYHDVRRVGSFLAQFDDAGHLQGLTQSESRAKGAKRGWKFSLGGGVGEFGTAEASAERAPGEGGSETSERVYDPLWTNARALLDYLAGRGMIQRDIHKASIGQFVLVKGTLVVLDVAMLKNAWDKPAIKKRILAEAEKQAPGGLGGAVPTPNRHERRRAVATGQAQRQDGAADNTQFLIDLLTILPHSIQAQLVGEGFRVWCSLSEESLVGLSSDLVLKHGTYVPGGWNMLGILDAYQGTLLDTAEPWKLSELEKAVAGVAGSLVGTLAAQLSPLARQLLGRPQGAHGTTPLLIFREVSG